MSDLRIGGTSLGEWFCHTCSRRDCFLHWCMVVEQEELLEIFPRLVHKLVFTQCALFPQPSPRETEWQAAGWDSEEEWEMQFLLSLIKSVTQRVQTVMLSLISSCCFLTASLLVRARIEAWWGKTARLSSGHNEALMTLNIIFNQVYSCELDNLFETVHNAPKEVVTVRTAAVASVVSMLANHLLAMTCWSWGLFDCSDKKRIIIYTSVYSLWFWPGKHKYCSMEEWQARS